MCLCFADGYYTPVEMWEKIIDALKKLDRNDIIDGLRLEERLAAAEDQLLVRAELQ